MKRIVLLFTITIFLFSCKKDLSEFDQLSSSSDRKDLKTKHARIEVCHYDKEKGTSHQITIDANAWPAHQKHGDVLGNCSVETVTICDQTWMLKNLDIDHYRNGDPIPEVTDPAEWASLTTGAWCYWFNDPGNGPVYGKLYNWYAVNDPRGLAPAGWHVPSKDEWDAIINCLGGDDVAGGKLKETGTAHWLEPNFGATNESGFTALGGNLRQNTGAFWPHSTTLQGWGGSWWTSTEYRFDSNIFANNKFIYSDYTSVGNGG
jgi:uncharacterized protein (TIGR02145 family)